MDSKERCKKWRETHKEEVKRYKQEYYQKHKKEIKAKNKEKSREYYQKNKEKVKARHNDWHQRNKTYIKNYYNQRYKTDEKFAIKERLRRLLRDALEKYGNGKIMKSTKYNIDYEAIIKHLGKCPGDRKDYNIDHIKPLCLFDLTDLNQIQLAFAPENHQWLLAKENKIKNKKFSAKD